MISRIIPIFLVISIDDAIKFYESIGFKYDFHYHLDGDKDKPKIFAALTWNKQHLYIQQAAAKSRNGAYMMHDDVLALQKSFEERGVNITYGPIEQPYRIRELHIEDPWGNQLSFAEYLQ
ncbi:MAG: VOC family protein [Bacteroidota bacterium]